MYNKRKNTQASERTAARRQREDAAPRLSVEVPTLETFRLEIEERTSGRAVAEPTHLRHIVVTSAPALFNLPCGDPRCQDGGHDITYGVLRSLKSGETRFTGDDTCHGSLGTDSCSRVLHYTGIATYR